MARCDILVTYYNTVFENTYFTFFSDFKWRGILLFFKLRVKKL